MKRFAQDATTEQLLTGLSQQYAEVSKLIRDLQGPISDLKKVEITRQELFKRLQPFGDIINRVITAFKPKTAEELHIDLIVLADDFDRRGNENVADTIDEIILTATEVPQQSLLYGLVAGHNLCITTISINELTKMADYLDENGFCSLADMVDKTSELLVKCATYIPRMRGDQSSVEAEPIMPPHEGNLSTRYCPDHVGVQSARIAEHIYQCPLDGKVYNYEAGYVNYQGQRVLGGSIAEQTPPTSDFGGIPMRVYDSRQNVLNSIY